MKFFNLTRVVVLGIFFNSSTAMSKENSKPNFVNNGDQLLLQEISPRSSKTSKAKKYSDSFGSLSIGHNLSANNKTLDENQWTLGTLYTAYGINDRWSLGTSFFVLTSFKMYNIMTRYAVPISSKEKIGFDFAYFKTFGGREVLNEYCLTEVGLSDDGGLICGETATFKSYSGFVMEALNSKFTYSYQVNNFYRLSSTLSYFYYFDERMPFSFRMDPANSDPFSLNISTLNEFKVDDQVFVNAEAGLWGLNYEFLYYHAGLSVGVQNNQSLVSLGVSTTFSPTFPKERAKRFVGYDSRFSVHPEIQIQLFF